MCASHSEHRRASWNSRVLAFSSFCMGSFTFACGWIAYVRVRLPLLTSFIAVYKKTKTPCRKRWDARGCRRILAVFFVMKNQREGTPDRLLVHAHEHARAWPMLHTRVWRCHNDDDHHHSDMEFVWTSNFYWNLRRHDGGRGETKRTSFSLRLLRRGSRLDFAWIFTGL